MYKRRNFSGHRSSNNRRAHFRSKPKKQKLNISSFINKDATSATKEKTYVPIHTFTDFKLSPNLLRSLDRAGYIQPTPIQDQIIIPVIQGKDMVGQANTGTGKTAAFLIPLIDKVIKNSKEQVFIIVPTRELAQQIDQELKNIIGNLRISSVICVGGERKWMQVRSLRYRNNFIIGTPGRLIDLVKDGTLILKDVRTVVLDEADRMLDMGFIKDIRYLMNQLSNDRQSLCFSATMSGKIESLINDFLVNPGKVSVITSQTPESIVQDIVRIGASNKIDVLYDLLKNSEFKKVLVFGRTKHGVEKLLKTLMKRGLKVESIHGNKSQVQRNRALASFKNNRVQALIATDVAARGIHIDNVTHVINYDIPETYDDYVHRIGRTGRCSRQGKALTFID